MVLAGRSRVLRRRCLPGQVRAGAGRSRAWL